jgi:hypothetical protein
LIQQLIHTPNHQGSTPVTRTANRLLCTAIALALAGIAGTAAAQTASSQPNSQQSHPRRAQVNQRLKNQDKRIHQDVKNGTMTKSQAASDYKQHAQDRQEERSMASQNGGHITKSEQHTLNQQENAESSQIPPK